MTTEVKPDNSSAFKMLFDIATDGIFIEDETGTILECNPAAEKMFGYLPGELKYVHIGNLVPPDFAKLLPKVITDEHVTGDQYLERVNMKKDGTLFPTEICTKWAYFNGKKRLIAFIHDITKRKETENELHKAKDELEKTVATRDTFLSILSHDLKSPMQSVLGFTELIDEKVDDSQKELRHFVEQLKISTNNSYTLIENLLNWTLSQTKRIEPHIEEFILGSFCASQIQSLQDIAQNKGISFTKHLPENLRVRTDKNMLLFVVRNLITNAVKFTHNGGNIGIIITPLANNKARFTIKDNGIGLTPKQIEKVKDKHTIYSTKGTKLEKGTGLGLKACND
ncbi:MAG TPA: PAS domain-containing sensor histidine kinase, partial [Prolixibacteraceae bacterium]|nr:PAS domain-containing sensor histidine kinase [Prolixibacteraceae bacterium]